MNSRLVEKFMRLGVYDPEAAARSEMAEDPVISPQIVLGVWCNSPAEQLELCLDRGLGGCPYGVVLDGVFTASLAGSRR